MAYNPTNPNGQATSANSTPVVIASDQSNVDININNQGLIDTFGKLMTSQSFNDIDDQFFRDNPNNILTVTTAGGGTAQGLSGYAHFATSTGATGSVTAVSLDKTHYHSGGEIYAMWASAFLDGGVATSVQRVGLFDTSNGFFIGYENTSFGLTLRNNGVDTTTAQASFNVDTLTGGSTSQFTSNGTPVALDPTKLNVYRIRFGWLGSASVKFEILSPDGGWVLFNIIRVPNTSATPSIANADLPMTLQVTKTAGATDLNVNLTCWGAGIQYDSADYTQSSTLGTAVNSEVEYNISALGSGSVYIGTTATGTIIFEATIDGKTWFTHPQVYDAITVGVDTLVDTSFTPVSGNYYLVTFTGYSGFRVRTATTLNVAVTLYFAGDIHDLSIVVAPPPHNIGYIQVHKDSTTSATLTSSSIWAPTTGKKFIITDITIAAGGTTAGVVTIYDAASATAYSAGVTPAIFRGEVAPSTNSRPVIVKNFAVPYQSTTVNNNVLVTTSAAINPLYIQINGYEI